jgi:hypothetical protein
MDDLTFKITECLLWVVSLSILLLIFVLVFSTCKEYRCCERFEKKVVHQEAWTQWVSNGKTMYPIHHPEGDHYKNVCVKPKDNCK